MTFPCLVSADPHMHGDRSHTHALPQQGLNHNHGDGPKADAIPGSPESKKDSNSGVKPPHDGIYDLSHLRPVNYAKIAIDWQKTQMTNPQWAKIKAGQLKVIECQIEGSNDTLKVWSSDLLIFPKGSGFSYITSVQMDDKSAVSFQLLQYSKKCNLLDLEQLKLKAK